MWGIICGSIAISVYALLSRQEKIAHLKKQMKALRGRMLNPDLEHADFMSLVKDNLYVSMRLLGTLVVPSIVSAIPVIILALWFALNHTFTLPIEGDSVEVRIEPRWDSRISASPSNTFVVRDDSVRMVVGQDSRSVQIEIDDIPVYLGNPVDPPVGKVEKRQWWNSLVENPAGYIEKGAPVSAIIWAYPKKIYIKNVPTWLGTWEFTFFMSVFVAALGLKIGFRIE